MSLFKKYGIIFVHIPVFKLQERIFFTFKLVILWLDFRSVRRRENKLKSGPLKLFFYTSRPSCTLLLVPIYQS